MRIRWNGFELPSRVICDEATRTDNFGSFVVEPFEYGFGHTIGNSLRRVLLGSIEGAAPYAVRIEGASHEFATIDGVYQDVAEIMLNIKKLVVRLDSEEPSVIRIEKTGAGDILAGDLICDHNCSIANPDLVIATLTEDISFNGEILVKKGRGYEPSEEHETRGDKALGLIYIDSIFSPITNVKYSVSKTRVGRDQNYDRLTLDITTDGSISPEEALNECAVILRKHLNPFMVEFDMGSISEGGLALEEEVQEEVDVDPELAAKLAESIRILDPSVRVSNCLEEANIRTLGDLVSRTETELSRIRNFGKTSLDELREKLSEMGLSFGMRMPTATENV